MTNEPIWNVTVHSDSRMNRMTNIPNTGTALAALDKTKHGILICTASGSGLIKDHVYLCNADGDALIDLSAGAAHTHTSSTTGGELMDIFIANPRFMQLDLTKTTDLYEASWTTPVYWIRTVTSTGSVENKTDGTTGERSIRLRPNATSGSGATISYPHHKLGFDNESIFQAKLQIETASSIALHVGVNADDVTAADSNTVKYNAEVCTATNSNWFLRTASGSANSTSDTGTAMTANRVLIKIVHLPNLGTPECDLYIDAGTVFQKTTNVPVSGATASNNLIKSSVKNNTAADRPLLNYGFRLKYTIDTSDCR
jgi:hypothetical protein